MAALSRAAAGEGDGGPKKANPNRVGPAGEGVWRATVNRSPLCGPAARDAPLFWRSWAFGFRKGRVGLLARARARVYFVRQQEDKECPERAVSTKQTAQNRFPLTKATVQYLSDSRSNCHVSSRSFHIIRNEVCTYGIDLCVCVRSTLFGPTSNMNSITIYLQ